MRPILSGLSMVTVGRLGAAATGLITQIYLAQMLSAAALGSFFLATSLAAFLAILATRGLPLITTRFLVRYRRRERADYSGLFMATTRRTVLTTSLVVTAVAATIISLWPDLPSGERIALLIGSLAAPGFALSRLSGSAATAYRRFRLAYLPDLVARPVLFLAAVVTIGVLTAQVSLTLTLAIFVLLVTAQAVFQFGVLRKIIPPGAQRPRGAERLKSMWLGTALPLTGVILVTAVFADVAILAAGLFLGTEELAVFGVCVKVALVVGFIQTAAHRMLQPDLAEAIMAGDRRGLSRTINQANMIGVGVGVFAFLVVLATSDLVLSLFGEYFVTGRNVLLALLAGQILIAAAGPAIQILTLARGQAAAAWASLAAGLCLLSTSALFIPPLGLNGAAVTMVSTQIVWAALLAVQVRRIGFVADVFSMIGPPRRGVPSSVAS